MSKAKEVGGKPSAPEATLASPPVDTGATPKSQRIGDRLIEMGIISVDQLNVALREKQKTGKMLGEVLVALNFIDEATLVRFLSESMGYHQFDHRNVVFDPEALGLITQKDAAKHQMLPISLSPTRDALTIAMADPYDVVALDKLRQVLPKGVEVVQQVASVATILDCIHRAYGATTSIEGILKEIDGDKNAAKRNMDNLVGEEAYSHPIVRLVNAMVFEAVKMGVSDLHFEPEENFVRVRYRMDGDLRTVHTFYRELWGPIAQRFKIMAEMNIADKLSPQDGRFSMSMGGRETNFRVSALPTVHGENIVLRVLDAHASIVTLDKLSFSAHNMHLVHKCLARPEGMIIVTGPTGSGKTTTLYSMLGAINTVDVNIMTLEDPVEYALTMIRQAAVRENVGLSFGDGVKALLRQDPDIIFIGEIRDPTTAEQALKAAMTGHQVFTTLHTNDSFGAIPRLADLGLKPGLISGSIIASFAQRLVRKTCQNCKEAYTASPEECQLLNVDLSQPPTLYKGKGCSQCDNGQKGRVPVHEILYIDEEIDTLISADASKHEIKAVAIKNGFKSMREDGIMKVYEGSISLEALTKAVSFSDRM